jgi:integrase
MPKAQATKRRTKGTGGLRERSPGRWELKWREAGNWRYKTVRAKNRKDANEQLLAEIATADKNASKLLLKDYARYWLQTRKGVVGGSTLTNYEDMIERHFIPAMGKDLVSELKPVHFIGYRTARLKGHKAVQAAGNARQKLAPNTVRNHLRVLSQILELAVGDGLLAKNPMAKVDLPKVEGAETEVLTEKEVVALLGAVKPEYRLLTLLLVQTGMRIGEAMALRWTDYQPPMLKVQRTLRRKENGSFGTGSPKSSSGVRDLKLSGSLQEQLDEHRALQAQSRQTNPKGLIFPNSDGGWIGPDNYRRRVFKPALTSAKITKPVRVHDLRHTHASLAIQQNVNPKVLSYRLGHATVGFTLDVYGHLYDAKDGHATDVLDLS